MQSKAGSLYLNRGDLRWSVVDPLNEVRVYDHSERAGLQISDAVAAAFYQAVDGSPHPECAYAMALEPRMARDPNGKIFEYGLKLMPTGYHRYRRWAHSAIFEFYRKK
jgi:hypothetical protein